MVTNFIAAPFNARVAMTVEQQVRGDAQADASAERYSLLEPLHHVLRKFLFLLARAVPLGLLFFIPGLNLLAPFA